MITNRIKRITAAMLTAAAVSAALPTAAFAAMDKSEFGAGYTYSTEMRGLTAFQIVNDMGAGWNLGNTLESSNNETYWGNPKTTKAMIDDIADKGFTTLRVPVRWDDHYSNASKYIIDDSYMDRVETVVNYGLANDMYVIVNIHHNDLQTMLPNTKRVSEELVAVWKQIAERFKKYGDKLIFEINNEPRGLYSNGTEDWTGNKEFYDSLNVCNEAARAAIRATGGNNKQRLIMLPTYCASCDASPAMAWEKNPDDDMIAASVHAYLPFDFAFTADGHTDWRDSDLTELESFFARVEKYFLSKDVPVVIGEFGARNKTVPNTAEREKYAYIYGSLARRFAQQDLPCVWWDNGCFYTDGENFGIYNRKNGTWEFGGIADGLIRAYDEDPTYEKGTDARTTISSNGGSCSNWGQAVSFAGSVITGLSPAESIYAEYKSDKAPELILQSFSVDGKGWVKVNPDSYKDGVAVWSYKSLLAAYGNGFVGLDKVYIGDVGTSLTVSKVYSVDPTAHTHNYNGAKVQTIAPTATTEGREITHCSVDGCDAYRVSIISESTAAPSEGKNGDANGDGYVNVFDVSAILRHSAKLENVKEYDLADYTNDGYVNSIDAGMLLSDIVNQRV